MMRHPGTSERPDQPLAVVIGTGALGSAIARRLGMGHRLLLADRDGERAAAFAATLREEGHDASAITCDVTDARQVEDVASAATGWRTLAHVAALSPSMADFRTILEVNLVGTLNVEAAFRPTASAGSAAIFISSLGAHGVLPGDEVMALFDEGLGLDLLARLERLTPEPNTRRAYQLSKMAMNRMCRRQAAVWGERGARILSLSPGLIATPMGALEFKGTPEKMDLYLRTPLQREGTMLEIAEILAFLASPAASFISGTDILVDGGLAAANMFRQQ
jgi:NAD(P)-dependent dehydrogenase (short-subunit alcohol dehydrogenase family)